MNLQIVRTRLKIDKLKAAQIKTQTILLTILFSFFLLFFFQIKLKKVLGLTVCSNAALDVSPTTGVLAYPAGYDCNQFLICSIF